MGFKRGSISKQDNCKSLKKHVAAIHSGSKLTLIQRKLANALLFNAYENLLTSSEHVIRVNDLCSLIGYKSKDFLLIKKALRSLLATVVEWNLIDKEKGDGHEIWNASSIIADVSIDGPICIYSYSNRMKELLYHPDMYGKLDMLTMSQFKSTYALALYENCTRYRNVNQTPWIELDVFRKLMGVDSTKYKIFRDFKRRVIEQAMLEVNEITGYELKLETKKNLKNVVAVKFHIIEKNRSETQQKKSVTNPEIQSILINDFGFNQQQANAVSENYDDDYVKEKIDIIRLSPSFKDGMIKNLTKYLQSGLQNDFKPPKSSKKATIKVKEDKEKTIAKNSYQQYFNAELFKAFSQSGLRENKKFLSKFEGYLSTTLYYNLYKRKGLDDALIKQELSKYLMRHHKDLATEIISYEEFKQMQLQKELV